MMKLLWVLLCVTYATCFYIDVRESSKDEIVDGKYTRIHKIPYQASLEYKIYSLCGAAIISNLYVVLAAQCFVAYVNMKKYGRIRVGTSFKESKGKVFGIRHIKMHELFDNDTLDNDIAVAELDKTISFTRNVRLIEIAKPDESPKPGDDMLISGFGDKEFYFPGKSNKSTVLRLATVKVLENFVCNRYNFFHQLPDEMFCVQAGASEGDSGSPGVINGKLAGIVSTGGIASNPSVYVKVSKYYYWIHKNTNLEDS